MDVITSVFKRQSEIEAQINKPDIVTNVEAQNAVKDSSKNEQAVAKALESGDVSEIRKIGGE